MIKKPQKFWTPEQERILMVSYGAVPTIDLAKQLRYSVNGVRNKAMRMGLSDVREDINLHNNMKQHVRKGNVSDIPTCPGLRELLVYLKDSIPPQVRVTYRTLASDEKRAIAKELRASGLTTRQVAEEMGCSHTWVRQLLAS